jgi:hypothetical protein
MEDEWKMNGRSMENKWINSVGADPTKSPEKASHGRDLLPDYIIFFEPYVFTVWPAIGRLLLFL